MIRLTWKCVFVPLGKVYGVHLTSKLYLVLRLRTSVALNAHSHFSCCDAQA